MGEKGPCTQGIKPSLTDHRRFSSCSWFLLSVFPIPKSWCCSKRTVHPHHKKIPGRNEEFHFQVDRATFDYFTPDWHLPGFIAHPQHCKHCPNGKRRADVSSPPTNTKPTPCASSKGLREHIHLKMLPISKGPPGQTSKRGRFPDFNRSFSKPSSPEYHIKLKQNGKQKHSESMP